MEKIDDMDEEEMVAYLLSQNIIFIGEKEILHHGESLGFTSCLFVCCNDVFAWGCADCENLPYGEINTLYDMCISDDIYGAVKWCCFQRNQKPQNPVVKMMKDIDEWDEKLENLPENHYDKMLKEQENINAND